MYGDPESIPGAPADLLRRHGVRVTAQRVAVLQAVGGQPHATAHDVAEAARARIGVISRQAVYDALGVLVDKGILRRIQPAGSPARYEHRAGDEHHHLICRGCGGMFDVEHVPGAALGGVPAGDRDFEIDETEVIHRGHCPACRRAGAGGHAVNELTEATSTDEERDEH